MGILSAAGLMVYTLAPADLQKQFPTPLVLAWGMFLGGAALIIATIILLRLPEKE